MYIRRRVCAEQDMKGGRVHVLVYQENGENLNDLISVSEFNLGISREPRIRREPMYARIDKAPPQDTLPGCVWRGRSDEIIAFDDDSRTHSVTDCMIFNVSKCWYSPILSRETTGGCDRELDWYGRFRDPLQAVNFLTDPERGLGVCCDDELEKVFQNFWFNRK